MARLSLLPNQSSMPFDVSSPTLYCCDDGAPGFSLNLAGRGPLTLHDVFTDTSRLLTNLMPAMELRVSGAPIGGMTANAGLAAAFDGNLSKSYTACAKSSAAVNGYALANSIGIAPSSPSAVTRIVATSPADSGFLGNGQKTTYQVVASNTNDPLTATVLKSGYSPPSSGTAPVKIEARFPNGLQYPYCWVMWFGNGMNNVFAGQIEAFATLPFSARGITTIAGKPVNANAMTALADTGNVSVAPGAVEYLGTILMSETAGVMRFTRSYGLNRMIPIWNMNNRERITVTAGDNRPSLDGHERYTPAAQADYGFGPTAGNPQMCVTFINGMAEGDADLEYVQSVFQNGGAAATAYWAGIALNPFSFPHVWKEHNFDSLGTAEGDEIEVCGHVSPNYGALTATAVEGSRGNVTGFFGEDNQGLSVTVDY